MNNNSDFRNNSPKNDLNLVCLISILQIYYIFYINKYKNIKR